jgi:hypothetical protein
MRPSYVVYGWQPYGDREKLYVGTSLSHAEARLSQAARGTYYALQIWLDPDPLRKQPVMVCSASRAQGGPWSRYHTDVPICPGLPRIASRRFQRRRL